MYASLLNAYKHGFYDSQYSEKVYFDPIQFESYRNRLDQYYHDVDDFISRNNIDYFALSYDDLFLQEKLQHVSAFISDEDMSSFNFNDLGLKRQWQGGDDFLERFVNPKDVLDFAKAKKMALP